MKHLLSLAAAFVLAAAAQAAAEVGKPAPAFTLTDTAGATHSLADFKGKYVVLEWYNPNCPIVVRHYKAGNMQARQAEFTAKGVVWLQVNSTSASSGDYLAPDALAAKTTAWKSAATATLMDADGKVGKAYDARTTPHMFVIDPAGTLIYNGAIDDNRRSHEGAKNYVAEALTASLAGQPVATATTSPYGCGVKY